MTFAIGGLRAMFTGAFEGEYGVSRMQFAQNGRIPLPLTYLPLNFSALQFRIKQSPNGDVTCKPSQSEVSHDLKSIIHALTWWILSSLLKEMFGIYLFWITCNGSHAQCD